ncbi:Flagellar motor switch protein FliG [subsurface metagenome]
MKELSNSITCISKRQDEMSDQINFSTSENSKPEIMKPTTGRPFEFTRMVDIKFILDFILGEHPQTIAMILSHLETEKGAIIISVLPEELQPLVTERIAIMGRVSPDVLNKVSRVMELKLKILSDQDYADSGGLGAAAELLSLVDRGTEKNVIETLKKKDPELAEEIKMRMFVFEDIILLSPDDVKSVLERADMTDILLALKGVSSEVQDFILENLTAKRAEKARQELAVRNPKRLIEVEEGQQNIEKIIRSMEEDGKIVVDRPGGKV